MEKPPTLAGGAGAFPGGQYVCIETTTSVIIYYIGHVDKLTGPKSPLLVPNVLPYTCRESTPTAKRDFGGLGVLFFLGIRATKAQNIDERRNGIMTEADNRDTKKAPAATGAGAETDAGGNVSKPDYTINRPTRQRLDENVPAELAELDQWAAWRAAWNPDRGRYDKPPVCPGTGRAASVDNPRTWGSLDAAIIRAEKSNLAGVGFVLAEGGGIVGIDLDHVRDRQTGHISEWASTWVRRLASYAEISPSGTGIRIFAKGKLPPGGRKCAQGEMYEKGRFLTVTGDHLPGTPRDLEASQEAIDALHAELFPTTKPARDQPPADQPRTQAPSPKVEGYKWAATTGEAELLQRAKAAKNGAEFAALYGGDTRGYTSPSEADLALCSRLGFWTGHDPARMDALFRQSGLYRPKWDEMHGAATYGQLTIAKALNTAAVSAQDPSKAQGSETGRGPRPTTEDYIRLFEGWGYRLAINDADDRLLCNGQPMTDTLEAAILAQVRDYGIRESKNINTAHAKEALQVMANQNRFHPVKQYLDGLNWDGQDHIGALCGYIREKQAGTFARWFTHWLVGAVARVYEPWQNPVLVLEGGQEIGKSYLARWLCPDLALFYAGPVCPDDRDNRIRRMSVWLWEIEELGSTTRRQDQEAVKGFITSTSIQDRRPYGHYDIQKPALASFVGTLNNDAGFLLDRTGNRRFLVAPLKGIDWAYAERVSLAGLWAQALAIYRAGDDWKLTDTDRRDRDAQNAEFMVDDPVEIILETLYEFTGNPEDFIASDTILGALHQQGFPYSKALTMTVASVLKSWGAEADRPRINGTKTRGFRGVAPR